jgi:hypothetical protein
MSPRRTKRWYEFRFGTRGSEEHVCPGRPRMQDAHMRRALAARVAAGFGVQGTGVVRLGWATQGVSRRGDREGASSGTGTEGRAL